MLKIMKNDILLVLGNGFDLDLGWKTTYADFYRTKRFEFNEIARNKYVSNATYENWCDLEKYLRDSALGIMEEKDVEDLWCYWCFTRSKLHEYLTENACKHINEKSCAYSVLQKANDCKIVSFNYTNPFESVAKREVNVFHIHYSLNSFNVNIPKIIFGFDENAMKENPIIRSNENLRAMVKSIPNDYDDEDRKSHLLKLLRDKDNIVFYGLSLSITDSDYFKSFFELLISGEIPEKNLYFVTKSPSGLIPIKENMEEWGINFDNLVFSRNRVVEVFTDRGIENTDFKAMLELL